MRRVLLLEHLSLDGFLAGPHGEMDWIRVDDELFAASGPIYAHADAAIFGRHTYAMMAAYWPTAAQQPGAGPHDISHARWINNSTVYVEFICLWHQHGPDSSPRSFTAEQRASMPRPAGEQNSVQPNLWSTGVRPPDGSASSWFPALPVHPCRKDRIGADWVEPAPGSRLRASGTGYRNRQPAAEVCTAPISWTPG